MEATDENGTRELGSIRARVLVAAMERIGASASVPESLAKKLKTALEGERPPKSADLVSILDVHFKEEAS